MTLITGQKAMLAKSKKDISNFKLRKGMPIGVMVTLRGEKMYEFLYLRSCYWVLITTLTICVFLNIFTNVLYYWAIIGFVMFIPLLHFIIKKKSHIFYQAIFGFCFLSLLYVNSTIYPLALFFGPVDRETAILYGWDNVTNKVEENKVE